jgi:6-phosphofructokinase 1
MGNKAGYIALEVALGAGAEEAIIPERKFNYDQMNKKIVEGNKKGKISWMIIVAEGAAKAEDVAQSIHLLTGLETRFVVLGHVQRGGTPVSGDRILATRLGGAAVDLLVQGTYGKAVGVLQNKINVVDLHFACKTEAINIDEYYKLIHILT